MTDQLTQQQETTKTLGTNTRKEYHSKFKKLKKFAPVAVFLFIMIYMMSNFGFSSLYTRQTEGAPPSAEEHARRIERAAQEAQVEAVRSGLPLNVVVPLCGPAGAERWSDPVFIPARRTIRAAWGPDVVRKQRLTAQGWVDAAPGNFVGAVSAVRYCANQPDHAGLEMPLSWP